MAKGGFGILHPGAMGAAVGAMAANSGFDVYWASENRRPQSRARAEQAGFRDAGSMARLCETSTLIASVCPPEFAEQVADGVLAGGFRGTFLDANAIAPQRKLAMAERMEAAGVRFIDGGIIGFPPFKRGQTWLCVSGATAADVARCLDGGPMEMDVIGERVGQASALKMCFAAWTKGSTALSAALLATAGHFSVTEDLKRQWARRGPDYEWVEREILRAAPKAWRFAPEMHEIAATFESAGMPGEFHRAAAAVYDRLAGFKDRDDSSLEEILRRMAVEGGTT
jgi:3-hydroxyisobutyrate dehydrogenase-like beta-hydroxyacid dehydrogenase